MERVASVEIIDCELGTLVGERAAGGLHEISRKPVALYGSITVADPKSGLPITGLELIANRKTYVFADLKGPKQPNVSAAAREGLDLLYRDLDYIHMMIAGNEGQQRGRNPDFPQRWQSATDDLAERLLRAKNFTGPLPEHPGHADYESTIGWKTNRGAEDYPILQSPRQKPYETSELARPGKYFLRNTMEKRFTIHAGQLNAATRRLFFTAHCHSMAYALNEATGLPIYALISSTPEGKAIKHLVVKAPDGTYLDSMGNKNQAQLRAYFPDCKIEKLDGDTANKIMNGSTDVGFYQEPRLDLARPIVAEVLSSSGFKEQAAHASKLMPPGINYDTASLASLSQ